MLIVALQCWHLTVDLEPFNTTFFEEFVQIFYEEKVVVPITSKLSVFFVVEGSGSVFGKLLHCLIEHPDLGITRDNND